MKIKVINGPNLNMLGMRPKEHYGALTLNQIYELMKKEVSNDDMLIFFQSNSEGDIVTEIQHSMNFDAIIINPAAYTHTSVAIRDALEIFPGKKIEVHLSDITSREDFRKINLISDVCDLTIMGLKEQGYVKAIKYLKTNE